MLHISGRVQGVGFRNFVVHHAQERSVTGYVSNLEDGSVEVMLQGQPADVGSVEAACRTGPALARVDNFECYPVDPDIHYETFVVKH